MPRLLIVEGEIIACMPDPVDTFRKAHPPRGCGLKRWSCWSLGVDGMQRIARQHVFEIGDDQLLMLLLVVETQRDDRCQARQVRLVGALQQI